MAYANILVNAGTEFTMRQYLTAHLPLMEPPAEFQHERPANPPTAPAFPAGLTAPEQAEVTAWINAGTTPTLAAAITKVAEYVVYYAAQRAWNFADYMARRAQFRIAFADAVLWNTPTLSKSADITGVGSAPPPEKIDRKDADVVI